MSLSSRLAVAAIAALFLADASGAAFARGSRSQDGDSWDRFQQQNPRFIEPGGDWNPARYRAYYTREGWYDRQRAAEPYRGSIRVRPYPGPGYYHPPY